MQQFNPARYEQLANACHRLFDSYGYERLETPILQPADLFLTRAGDQIIARLFTFERGGQQLALRPEYTSTALSLYCAERPAAPARWQFGGYVFEDAANTPQQQRYSIGAELFGLPHALADAEILEMALTGLQRAGIGDAVAIIGHVALLRYLVNRHVPEARLQRFLLNHAYLLRSAEGEARVRQQIERWLHSAVQEASVQLTGSASPSLAVIDALLQSLERSELLGGRTRDDIQRRLQRKLARAEARPQSEAALLLLKHLLTLEGTRAVVFPELRALIGADAEGIALLAQWDTMLQTAEGLGVDPSRLILAPGLSRNWDYYSGIVFELRGGGLHLGGGGRYDGLARLLGSPEPVPAVGFAYYVDEILAALPVAAHAPTVWTLSYATLTPPVAAWLGVLRGAGLAVALTAAEGQLTIDADSNLNSGGQTFAPSQSGEAIRFLEAHS